MGIVNFKKLIELVSGEEFGQIFITDTHPGRIQDLFVQKKILQAVKKKI